MFKSNEESKITTQGGPAHTLVSRSTEIVGDIHFSGELIIEGTVKGNIKAADGSDALVRLAENGTVEGEINSPSVIVNGVVKGDVRSTKHVELAAKAVIVGNVHYDLIEMVMGAEVNGSLMHNSAKPKALKLTASDDKDVDKAESDKKKLRPADGSIGNISL